MHRQAHDKTDYHIEEGVSRQAKESNYKKRRKAARQTAQKEGRRQLGQRDRQHQLCNEFKNVKMWQK